MVEYPICEAPNDLMVNNMGFSAFFLPAESGVRFAIFHPAQGPTVKGGVLYVHPFAEEMNKSRRMASLQARAFAESGYAVLQMDLYGCGDSSGDFVDARWEIWKRDLSVGADWLGQHANGPFHLWGLRLGATLGLDFCRDQPHRFASMLLWQPVLNGEIYMTQFLRMAIAGDVIRDTGSGLTTETLRKRLSAGESIEVAGYELAPELVSAIDAQKLVNSDIPNAYVHWVDVKGNNSDEPPPAAQRVFTVWREKGIQISYRGIQGDPFWTTQEIVEVPGLIEASTACLGTAA